ncbi:MAG: energy transducer TonB [Pseudomonadota bacterium]
MTNKLSPGVLAAMMLCGAAAAAEVPAAFDAKNCKVDYPKTALLNEEQGVTSMQFLVGADGKVLESKLEKTSGFKSLDKAALSAVGACKFRPGSKDGKPDQTWTRVDYAWSLK